jgi:hypothetical protein
MSSRRSNSEPELRKGKDWSVKTYKRAQVLFNSLPSCVRNQFNITPKDGSVFRGSFLMKYNAMIFLAEMLVWRMERIYETYTESEAAGRTLLANVRTFRGAVVTKTGWDTRNLPAPTIRYFSARYTAGYLYVLEPEGKYFGTSAGPIKKPTDWLKWPPFIRQFSRLVEKDEHVHTMIKEAHDATYNNLIKSGRDPYNIIADVINTARGSGVDVGDYDDNYTEKLSVATWLVSDDAIGYQAPVATASQPPQQSYESPQSPASSSQQVAYSSYYQSAPQSTGYSTQASSSQQVAYSPYFQPALQPAGSSSAPPEGSPAEPRGRSYGKKHSGKR